MRVHDGAQPLSLCLTARGRIAAFQRDWPSAQAAFAEAVRQGPATPFAYVDWGQMLFDKGDITGATERLGQAHIKGPRFADPLELWGEALMRQGDAAGAQAKFPLAAKYAPRCGRLHLRWGQALAKTGKPAEARAQWQAASALDLSAADRAELAGLMRPL